MWRQCEDDVIEAVLGDTRSQSCFRVKFVRSGKGFVTPQTSERYADKVVMGIDISDGNVFKFVERRVDPCRIVKIRVRSVKK